MQTSISRLSTRLLQCCFAIVGITSLSSMALGAAGSPNAAVKQALDTNPEVQIRWHAFQAAGFDAKKARAGYLPSIDINAGTGQQSRDFDGRGGYNINQLEISLTQMLFDGFRTKSDVSRLEGAQQVRFFELLGTIDTTAMEAVRAYDDVLRYRILLDLMRENYQQHLEIEGQIREQVEQGVGRGADLDQVNGRVALAESNLLAEAANLHDVTARYLRVVGELPADNAEPVDVRYATISAPIQDVLYAAYQGNSDFHAAIKNIEVSQSFVSQERSGLYPNLEFRARSGLQGNLGVYDDRIDPDDYGSDTVLELAFSYNLYRGGADKAAVRRSLSLVDEAKSQRDQACVNLRQTVQIAYNDTQRIEERLVALRQHRDLSNQVRDSYAEQFQIGQRTLLDLLDAENEFFQSSRAVVESEHELTISHVELLAATGGLLPALNVVQDELMFLGVNGELSNIEVEPSAVCPAISPRSLAKNDLIVASYMLETDVLFDTGLSTLSPAAFSVLDKLISELNAADSNIRIKIEAHADNTGTDAINMPLSEARARSVRDYLVINGLMSNYMQVQGYGSAQPIASNDTVEGRRANRRVEIFATLPSHVDRDVNYLAPGQVLPNITNLVVTETAAYEMAALTSALEYEAALQKVNSTVASWLNSWQNQEVEEYFSYFHADYIPDGFAVNDTWMSNRAVRISAVNGIDISYENLQIIDQDEWSTLVQFTMNYRNSSGYADQTQKQLRLVNDGGRFLIAAETNLDVAVL